jgi:hypothetical protein
VATVEVRKQDFDMDSLEADMAKKIIDTGKTCRRIEVTDHPARRIEPDALAAALGAEPVEIVSPIAVKSRVPENRAADGLEEVGGSSSSVSF